MRRPPVLKSKESPTNPMNKRRGVDRIPLSFSRMDAELNDTGVTMSNGTAIDRSREGLGVRGNQSVNVEMNLTLLLPLPDKKDQPFAVQTHVAWVHRHRFGLRPQHIQAALEHPLQRFIQSFFYTAHTRGTA